MNRAAWRPWRLPAEGICLAALVGAVGWLTVDYVVGVRRTTALAERLRTAEDAARAGSAAVAELEKVVRLQTDDSLLRWTRQRVAGAIALIAAASLVALANLAPAGAPVLPRNVATSITSPLQDSRSEQSDIPATPLCQATEVDVDLAPVEKIVARIGRDPRHLIPLLHAVDRHYRYLPTQALSRLTELTEMRPDQVAGVASFYKQFRTRPRGEHLIQVCRGTACHVARGDLIYEQLRRALGIPPGDDTDPQRLATIESVGCLGCCTLAPVVQVDGRIEGHVGVEATPRLTDWSQTESSDCESSTGASTATRTPRNGRAPTTLSDPPIQIRIGLGSCCEAGGSREVYDGLQREISTRRLNAVIQPVGCVGICHLTPLVEVATPGAEPMLATRATAADVRRIARTLPDRSPWPRRWKNRIVDLWQQECPPANREAEPCRICPVGDLAVRRFLDPQVRIVTEHSGTLDPTSLQHYRQHEGLAALEKCLHGRSTDSIVDSIDRSGLRGRGGGGFPTATKWRKVREASGEKFVICNGDEGDPGAFMDRMIMESFPYRVLEGMAIAAFTVGAQQGFVYVRHEYPLAVKRLRQAIDAMRREGLLGESILGTTFSFDVEIFEGAGAFVCGEETALLQSMMGRRGTPQFRPPYPVERGLFDQPTLINNVETYANVPWIMRHGPERFAALGTEHSKGTKVFALAGKVRRGGLIEIPMGTTIRNVVENIGGGVPEGKRFKAVQIGGPSGGCVPAELADTPIDYENLRNVGAIVGSGGLVVLDDDDCMVDVARYFLEFTERESCGHCTFCRVGTRKLLDILERICVGKGKPKDLGEIESLATSICLGSLCGLGKTAPNPVLSTLKYFRDEYEAHLEGRCPAGRCKALIRYVATNDCVGCTLCAQHCPAGAIPATPYRQHVIDADVCTRCDACRVVCPENAIAVV